MLKCFQDGSDDKHISTFLTEQAANQDNASDSNLNISTVVK